jgi:hypothetical protein
VPFTFLPHQAPLLPLVGRERRWDAVALVAGSTAPDLFYVTNGWGYGPFGRYLWFDGHALRNQFWVVALALALTVVIRRVVMPVLPLALPDVGGLGLRQYAAAARHRYRWWVTLGSAVVGTASHLLLDSFTHTDGAVVQAFGPLRWRLFAVAGRGLSVAGLLQYGGSAVGVVAAVVLLRRLAARGAIARGEPLPPGGVGSTASGLLWGSIALGVIGGVAYAWSRREWLDFAGAVRTSGSSVVIMAFCWVAFGGVLLGCLLARLAQVTSPGRSTPAGAGARSRWSYRDRVQASRSSPGRAGTGARPPSG